MYLVYLFQCDKDCGVVFGWVVIQLGDGVWIGYVVWGQFGLGLKLCDGRC